MGHGRHSCLTSFPLRSSFSTCLGDEDCTGTGCRVTELMYRIGAQSSDSETKTVGFDGEVYTDWFRIVNA
jgi:hypothetical protein